MTSTQPLWQPSKPRSRLRLAESLVDKLSEMMRSGILKEGEKLPAEQQIMLKEGVSRTVVRDALSRLQVAGLVETRPGVGSFVCDLPGPQPMSLGPATIESLDDVLELLELRMCLETATAGLAALRHNDHTLGEIRVALDALREEASQSASLPIGADFQFHLKIAKASASPYLINVMKHLGAKLIPRHRLNSAQNAHPGDDAYRDNLRCEHEAIYECIARRDVDSSRSAMLLHLINSRERLLRAQRAGG